jgi:hypothetical protein
MQTLKKINPEMTPLSLATYELAATQVTLQIFESAATQVTLLISESTVVVCADESMCFIKPDKI